MTAKTEQLIRQEIELLKYEAQQQGLKFSSRSFISMPAAIWSS
jgi:hypothetical protein